MNTVFKNFIYNTGYQILAIIVPIITTPYLSRIIGVEGIGKYSYANSIAYYFVMFIMLGLNNYGNRTIAGVRDDKNKLSKTFCEIYFMQLMIGIVVLIIYIIFCALFMPQNIIQWIMIVYVVSAIIDINWFFFGLEQFKLTATRNIIIKLITTISIFCFVKHKEDIVIYVLIVLLSMLISNAILWPFVFEFVSLTKVNIRSSFCHIKPNLILFIPIVAISLYKGMDKIMLGIMCNIEQVGYYEYSEKIIQIPIALVNSLGTVMLPKMSNLVANGDIREEKRYISISILVAMLCSSSLCFGLMAIAREFVPLFYGKGYEPCVHLFYILLPSCCFMAFANVIRTQYLIPHKKDEIYIKSVILGALVNFFLNIILIRMMLSAGAAIATLAAELTVCLYQAFKTEKVLPIKKYFKNSIPFVASGIIMFVSLINISIDISELVIIIGIKIILGVIIYFSVLTIILLICKNDFLKEIRIKWSRGYKN